MTTKVNAILFWFAAAVMIISLAACDTRPIPGDLILSTYNSEMEATKNFSPMDTLYIKVAGMGAGQYYQVSALDADGHLISKIEAQTNDEGGVGPIPLWYNVGLKSNGSGAPPYIDSYGDLTPVGFKVNVKSLFDDGHSTDFTQDMFIIYGKADTDHNPKPVLYSCYSPDGINFYPENAFKETGTKDVYGEINPKTMVYVKADRVPTQIANSVAVTAVDFYVLPFTGNAFQDGDDIVTTAVTSKTGVAVVDGAIPGTLLWDLNVGPYITNPSQNNMAYSIVMDVNQDGVFDAGIDTNTDGLADYYIDGVDGNGEPGFIIQNTPANDMFVTIKDGNGDIVNSIPERAAVTTDALTISIDNLPVAKTDTISIYLVDTVQDGSAAFAPVDVRNGGADTGIAVSAPAPGMLRYLPYIADNGLVNNKDVADAYTYTVDITEDTKLDLVVDMGAVTIAGVGTGVAGQFDPGIDYFLEDAVTILYVPPSPTYTTCSDDAGSTPTVYFDETNSDGNTVVYLKAASTPASTAYQYDVYVLDQTAFAALTDGVTALDDVAMISATDLPDGDGVNEIWDLDGAHQVINPAITNNTYYLVMDDTDGIYEASDTVLTIVILNTNANAFPRVTYVNIASGGSFDNTYEQHWTLYSEYCDYRDTFDSDGLDTNPNGGAYGVKGVFNPYFEWFYNPDPQTPVAGLYYGLYVDVYIVDADTFDLADYGHANELNDTVDVTGRHSTLCVQPSCYNGAGMMTIWPAQMTPGSYYVIVDVNRNGRIDEGADIIDAVNEAGETIIDDATIVGFSVE